MGLVELLTGNLSKSGFAKKFAKEIKVVAPSAVYSFDEAQFGLRRSDGDSAGWIMLSNFYAEYLRTPRLKRDQALRTIVSGHMKQMQAYEEEAPTKETLLPVVRDRSHSWISQMQVKKLMPDAPMLLPGKPLGEDHMSMLVLDSPTAMRYAGEKELNGLGLAYDEAFEEAIRNLREISPSKWLSLSSQAFVGQWNDTYDCSRLLLTDLIHRLEISGRPIAITPCRGILLIAGENNVDGQRIILELANGALEENSRWTSPEVLVLNHDRWEPFVLTDPMCIKIQQEMTVKMRKSVYDQQKNILDEANQAAGQDIFVASFMAYKKTDAFLSMATWSKGVNTWLPQTEFIVFMDTDGQAPIGVIPWDVAIQYAGELMSPVPDIVPVRYLVKGFPDEETLQVMTAEATV